MLPDYLQLAKLLNSSTTRTAVLDALLTPAPGTDGDKHPGARTLAALAPYLSLETLVAVRGHSALAGVDLSSTLDDQRDWVTSAACREGARDQYLVQVLGSEAGEWETVYAGMKDVAEGMAGHVKKGVVLEADGGVKPVEVKCDSVEAFREELKEASGGVLDKLDWSNVILGGGSVLSILTGAQNNTSYKGSDLDLFLVGLKPEELVPKVNSIVEQIKATLPPKPKKSKRVYVKDHKPSEVECDSNDEEWVADHSFDWDDQHQSELLVIKGFNAITLVPPKSVSPRRTIQIILHAHKTAFDALAGFDLDCCAIGCNGESVFAVPRAVRALALGANLLDVKLARKGDPTSSIVSSRSLKYLQRGFSLALPTAAQSVLAAAGIDFSAVLAAGRAKAANEAERKKVKTEAMSELGGMLRREWNLKNGVVGGRDKAPLGADYGPANSEWMRLVTDADLLHLQNGSISHEFWEHATKTMAPAISKLLRAEKKDMVKSSMYTFADDVIMSSYVVPYVSSFDNNFVLGVKEAARDPFKQKWGDIQNLQYIVKLPRSVLPIIDTAEQKLKEIAAANTNDSASPAKSAEANDEQVGSPNLAPDELEAIERALKAVKGVNTPNAAPSDLTDKGKGRPELSSPTRSPTRTKNNASNTSQSVLHPLLDLYGEESLKTKKTSRYVYRLAVLAGLWQFRGLDADVDKALNLIWQAWVATARAATSLPSEFPYGLEYVLDRRAFATLKAQYAAQAPTAEVLAQLARDVDRLEKVALPGEGGGAGAGVGAGMRKVGEWDDERKKFLLQWVRDEEML
ncbi:hypothetical protein JCM3770_005327 [Rhodotorula araucariae]